MREIKEFTPLLLNFFFGDDVYNTSVCRVTLLCAWVDGCSYGRYVVARAAV